MFAPALETRVPAEIEVRKFTLTKPRARSILSIEPILSAEGVLASA